MLKNKHTNYTIESPSEILKMESHMIEDLKKMLLSNSIFVIPSKITDNQKKLIYKVGFLKEVYSILFPKKSLQDLYFDIDSHWQIFKSLRQMKRLNKQYVELKEKGEI